MSRRLKELPVLINRCKQLTEVESDTINTQKEKLKECRENILLDCSLEFVIKAIERDIEIRELTLENYEADVLMYKEEYDKIAAQYSCAYKDISALETLMQAIDEAV